MLPLILALAASAAWGSADYLGGRASRAMSAFGVAALSKIAGASGLLVVCVVAGESPSGPEALWALGAGLSGALALPALYRALALGPMSLVAPLTACGGAVPVIVALAGGELPGPLTSAGLAVAFVGALVVSRPANPEAPVPGMRRAALAYALTAALAIGLALTMLQQGAQASADGRAAVVAVLGSLYPLATVFLARAWLGERLSAAQGAGVVAAMAGVAAIAAGS